MNIQNLYTILKPALPEERVSYYQDCLLLKLNVVLFGMHKSSVAHLDLISPRIVQCPSSAVLESKLQQRYVVMRRANRRVLMLLV